MAEKKKPQEDIVKLAGRAMTHPEQLTGSDIKRMAARILDDQRNDPEPGKKGEPSLAAKVIAKVGDLLPEALKTDTSPKATPAAKPKTPAAKPAVAAKPADAATPDVAAKPIAAAKTKAATKPKKA